jgi:hypothetical protein
MMLFPIKIADQSHYKYEKFPYVIRYELVPEVVGTSLVTKKHESRYKNFEKATKGFS